VALAVQFGARTYFACVQTLALIVVDGLGRRRPALDVGRYAEFARTQHARDLLNAKLS
jgi:hypothetical protein